jgi:hypothetical protein
MRYRGGYMVIAAFSSGLILTLIAHFKIIGSRHSYDLRAKPKAMRVRVFLN